MKHIVVEYHPHFVRLIINRPDQLNALNTETIEELHQALVEIKDAIDIRAVLLTGAGNKAFVAGADIKEFKDFDAAQGEELSKTGQDTLFDYIENFSKPVIALINGFALGGGLELALSCHMRIALSQAKMGLPETSLGLIPGYGGTQRLPMLIGKGRAMYMILTGEMIDGHTAKQYGLVHEVVDSIDEMNQWAEKTIEKITSKGPLAISKAIQSINAAYGTDGFTIEQQEFGKLFDSEQFQEGVSAFLEKRKPNFN